MESDKIDYQWEIDLVRAEAVGELKEADDWESHVKSMLKFKEYEDKLRYFRRKCQRESEKARKLILSDERRKKEKCVVCGGRGSEQNHTCYSSGNIDWDDNCPFPVVDRRGLIEQTVWMCSYCHRKYHDYDRVLKKRAVEFDKCFNSLCA